METSSPTISLAALVVLLFSAASLAEDASPDREMVLVLSVGFRSVIAPSWIEVEVRPGEPFHVVLREQGVRWTFSGRVTRVEDGVANVRLALASEWGTSSGVRSSGPEAGLDLRIDDLAGTGWGGSLRQMRCVRIRRGWDAVAPALRHLARRDDGTLTAVRYLATLGPEAASAVPALVAIVQGKENGPAAAQGRLYDGLRRHACLALAEIGESAREAAPKLRPFLTDEDGYVRVASAWALWKIERYAWSVTMLVATSREASWGARLHAVVRLGDLAGHPESGMVVGALRRALAKDDSAGVRLQAAYALGKWGPPARSAIPALMKALEDPDEDVRKAAAHALKQLEP